MSKIIPVFKKGDPTIISNYRPIAITHFIAKVHESVIHYRLQNFMHKFNIIMSTQFGFRSNHSTSTAISYFLNISRNISKNHPFSGAMLLDLSKAFDSLDHDILLAKLFSHGIRGNIYKWFKSFLKDRQIYTYRS